MQTNQYYRYMTNEMWYMKAKRLFRLKRISMQKLGDNMGLHKSTICLKLNGKVDCDSGEIMKLAEILDITVDQLLAGDPRYKEHSEQQARASEFIEGYTSLNETQKTIVIQLMESMTKIEQEQ